MNEQVPITPHEASRNSRDAVRDYKENYQKRVINERKVSVMSLISHPVLEQSIKNEKAQLWDAREDYQANKEAYEQAALEDAARAGVETSFGQSQKVA